jgi:hypothetical protein
MDAHEREALHCYHTRCLRDGVVLELDDFLIGFAVLDYLHARPKRDQSLPYKGARRVWTELYERGLVPRQFDSRRWGLIRQTIWNGGYANIESSDYWHDPDDKTKSQCMRWGLKDDYAYLVLDDDKAVVAAPASEEATRGGVIGRAAFTFPSPCPGVYYPNRLLPPGYDAYGRPIGAGAGYWNQRLREFFKERALGA